MNTPPFDANAPKIPVDTSTPAPAAEKRSRAQSMPTPLDLSKLLNFRSGAPHSAGPLPRVVHQESPDGRIEQIAQRSPLASSIQPAPQESMPQTPRSHGSNRSAKQGN